MAVQATSTRSLPISVCGAARDSHGGNHFRISSTSLATNSASTSRHLNDYGPRESGVYRAVYRNPNASGLEAPEYMGFGVTGGVSPSATSCFGGGGQRRHGLAYHCCVQYLACDLACRDLTEKRRHRIAKGPPQKIANARPGGSSQGMRPRCDFRRRACER